MVIAQLEWTPRERVAQRRHVQWSDAHLATEQALLELRTARRAIEELARRATDPDEWASWVGISPAIHANDNPDPEAQCILSWFTPPGVQIGSDLAHEAAAGHIMRLILCDRVLDQTPAAVGVWPVAIDRHAHKGGHVEPWTVTPDLEPGSVVAQDTRVKWRCQHGDEEVASGEFVAVVLPPPVSTIDARSSVALAWPPNPCPPSPDHVYLIAEPPDVVITRLRRLVDGIPDALARFVAAARGLALSSSRAGALEHVAPGVLDAGDLHQIAVGVIQEAAIRYAGPWRPAAALSSWVKLRVRQVQSRAVNKTIGEPERVGHARARLRDGQDLSDLSAAAQERVRRGRPHLVSIDGESAESDDDHTAARRDAYGATASAEEAYLASGGPGDTDMGASVRRLLALAGVPLQANADLASLSPAMCGRISAPWAGDTDAMYGALFVDRHLIDPDWLTETWLAPLDAEARVAALDRLTQIEGADAAEPFRVLCHPCRA